MIEKLRSYFNDLTNPSTKRYQAYFDAVAKTNLITRYCEFKEADGPPVPGPEDDDGLTDPYHIFD